MEDRETPRMCKYGERKRLELGWQLYRTSLPVRDLENFRPMDFCWTGCTCCVSWALRRMRREKILVSLSSYPDFDKEYQQRVDKPNSRWRMSGIHLGTRRDKTQLPAIKQDFT